MHDFEASVDRQRIDNGQLVARNELIRPVMFACSTWQFMWVLKIGDQKVDVITIECADLEDLCLPLVFEIYRPLSAIAMFNKHARPKRKGLLI